MRGLTPGAPSRVDLAAGLPALLADDDFAQRFTGALDEVVSPLVAALEDLPAYLDPLLTPPDFLAWLGRWVGVEGTGAQDEATRRLVAGAAGRYADRGTPAGVRADIALRAGLTADAVQLTESGGTSWSRTARSAPPGSPTAGLRVRVTARAGRRAVLAAVTAAAPAHLPVQLDLADDTDRDNDEELP